MIKLVEVCNVLKANKGSVQNYTLREIYINPKHIVSLREDEGFKEKLREGLLPDDLNNDHQFTRIVLDKGQVGLEIVVVGTPRTIEERMQGGENELLLG